MKSPSPERRGGVAVAVVVAVVGGVVLVVVLVRVVIAACQWPAAAPCQLRHLRAVCSCPLVSAAASYVLRRSCLLVAARVCSSVLCCSCLLVSAVSVCCVARFCCVTTVCCVARVRSCLLKSAVSLVSARVRLCLLLRCIRCVARFYSCLRLLVVGVCCWLLAVAGAAGCGNRCSWLAC